jgi:hypothetical protein
VTAAGIVLAALLRMQLQPQAQAPAADQVVVTAAPSIDAQRLADALRVYLDEFGIRVGVGPGAGAGAAAEAGDLRKRLDDARQLGEAVRAVAVVRAEHGARGAVEIELYDLATDKALVVSVPRPARDEDLYRALALKIQAVLRATLSEARGDLDPGSSLGRLVAQADGPAPAPPAAEARAAVALDAGYGVVSFPVDGPLFGGLAVRASWRAHPVLELGVGTAALGSASAASGTVEATATVVPVHVTARRPFSLGRAQLFVGPCVDATYIKVAVSSATTPVRSAVRNLMFGAGVEAEARVVVLGSAWLFARAAVIGVLNGERYDVGGAPLFDTSRLQLSGTVGAGVGL